MLQQLRRHRHLALYDLIDVGIRNSALQLISRHGMREVSIYNYIQSIICPHGPLLLEHAVEGKKSNVPQKESVTLNFER